MLDLCSSTPPWPGAVRSSVVLASTSQPWSKSLCGWGQEQLGGLSWTRNQKVTDLSPCRSGRIIFFPGSTFCDHSFFGICSNCVTALAPYRSQSSCQKCRWQVTAKHTRIPRMWLCMKWLDMVHSCTVYTEHAEMAAVLRGTSHVTTKQHCKYTTWVDTQNSL